MGNKRSFGRQFLISFAVLSVIPLLASCGLDTFYYLDPPMSDGHHADLNSTDESQNYFSCRTNEESSTGSNSEYFGSADLLFLGTEIYYRIYTNSSTMASVESSVSSMINATNYSSAAEYLISTKKYKPLGITHGSISPLIKAGSSPQNRYVYIRLTDDGADFPIGAICVSDSILRGPSADKELTFGGELVYPCRSVELRGFNFGKPGVPLPQSGDDDVEYGSGPEDGKWYVDMYAVSVGRDSSYALSYSQPHLMGAVLITE
ncbi:MAG: hypothetical protein II716_10165 [Treponema sp.]|nr:hypothetical protein [Treponema sp.]MBQ5384520.1 hypothetical protein [Treponema sp.]